MLNYGDTVTVAGLVRIRPLDEDAEAQPIYPIAILPSFSRSETSGTTDEDSFGECSFGSSSEGGGTDAGEETTSVMNGIVTDAKRIQKHPPSRFQCAHWMSTMTMVGAVCRLRRMKSPHKALP